VTENRNPDLRHQVGKEIEDLEEEVDLKGNLFLIVNLNRLEIIIKSLEALESEVVGKIIHGHYLDLMDVMTQDNLKTLITVIRMVVIEDVIHQNHFAKIKEVVDQDQVKISDQTKMTQSNTHVLTQ